MNPLRIFILSLGLVIISGGCLSSLVEKSYPLDEVNPTLVMKTVKAAATQEAAAVSSPPAIIIEPTRPVPNPEKPTPIQNMVESTSTKAPVGELENLQSTLKKFTVNNLYSVYYPPKWKITKTGGWQDFCSDSSKTACLHVQMHTEYSTTSQFLDETYGLFKQTVGDYQVYDQEDIMIKGFPARFYEHSYTFQNQYHQGHAAYIFTNKGGFQIHAEIIGQMQDYDIMYKLLKNMILLFEVER